MKLDHFKVLKLTEGGKKKTPQTEKHLFKTSY